MSKRLVVRRVARGATLAAIVVAATTAGACAESFDTSRPATVVLTLGDDLYGVLCDRVAATVDPADLEGRRSHAVCHPDAKGVYRSAYDPQDGAMPAKVAVMVRYRKELVEALNATFPDKESLQSDLTDLCKALVPLYDDDTLPKSTEMLGALFDAVGFTGKPPLERAGETTDQANARRARAKQAAEMRETMARLGGRRGYRTLSTALGVSRPLLAYPHFSDVADTTIRLVGKGGPAEPELRKLLEVAQAEMASSTVALPRTAIPKYIDRFARLVGQRPKLTSEILQNLLIDSPPGGGKGDPTAPAYPDGWTDAYASDGLGGFAPEQPILVRDPRGYAAFTKVPAGAVDKDGDGLPDVDLLGRFVDRTGAPLSLPTPFPVITTLQAKSGTDGSDGATTASRDALGRALAPGGGPLYRYRDASKTLLHALLVDVRVLSDPTNGALLDAAHAATSLFGARSPAATTGPARTTGKDTVRYDGVDGFPTATVAYRKYDAGASPLTDLVYAASRVFDLPKIADYIELSRQLLRDHPAETARVIGAALSIREMANRPENAGITLDPKSPLWDDILAVGAKIAAEPDLLQDVIEALANPDVLGLMNELGTKFQYDDILDYHPDADKCDPGEKCDAINRPWYNVTAKGQGVLPSTPTDLSAPETETNRSEFQRFAALIADSHTVRACNRPDARIRSKVGPFTIKLPPFGKYAECQVLDVPDLAIFYLGCLAGGDDEVTGQPRCTLPVTDTLVDAIKKLPFDLGDRAVDAILETSSGITGLKQVPTVEALNRLVMWRNPNRFVRELTDPIPSRVCPVTNRETGHRECASRADLIRERTRGTIFLDEVSGFAKAMRPLLVPFVKRRGADRRGREELFIEVIEAFHRHWSKGEDPYRCTKGASRDDPKHCSGSNVRAYEQLIAEAMRGDFIPAIHALTKLLKDDAKIKVRGQSGTTVLTSLVSDLLDPKKAMGATEGRDGLRLTDRKGRAGTRTNDGRPIAQVTPFYLFADALDSMDAQWTGPDGDALHQLWRASRGKLVDELLAVDATDGPTKSRFRNRAIGAALPIVLDLVEDRIEEHRAKGDLGAWARGGLAKSFEESLSGPLLASIFDLQEKIYGDKRARDTLGRLLSHLAGQASANDALATVVTATQDLLQLLGDERDMVPIYHAMSIGLGPDGAIERTLDLIDKIGGVEATPAWVSAHKGRRTLPRVMANIVTPMGPGAGRPAPIEVFMDVVADIHREDASTPSGDAFSAGDYGNVARNVREFLVDPTRGLEQFYAIVKKRNDL